MTIEIVQDEVAPATYARIIDAALHVKQSIFGLAEALALDIPPAPEGDRSGSVTAALKEVAQQIVDAGGDGISWRTLESYRATANWVALADKGLFQWREGTSYTAHQYAALGGLDYDEFAKQQRSASEVRKMLGYSVPESVGDKVDTMTDTDKADLIAALVKDNTEGVAAVVQTQRIDDLPITVSTGGGGVAPTVGAVSTSLDNYDRIAALKEVIGGTRQWMSMQLTKWGRAMYAVKGVMNEEDRDVLAGYYLDIAEQWTDAATKLKDNEWTQ